VEKLPAKANHTAYCWQIVLGLENPNKGKSHCKLPEKGKFVWNCQKMLLDRGKLHCKLPANPN